MKLRKDYVKLNVDAAFDADLLQGAVGAVLRHCHGKFMAAANEKIEFHSRGPTTKVWHKSDAHCWSVGPV